ncbi:MAG: hypothetical protein PHS37_00595 [Candidatus Omnitrophica bacterium]|nr:hypothetical protein [Candidatus Omnitrophota bacterium]
MFAIGNALVDYGLSKSGLGAKEFNLRGSLVQGAIWGIVGSYLAGLGAAHVRQSYQKLADLTNSANSWALAGSMAQGALTFGLIAPIFLAVGGFLRAFAESGFFKELFSGNFRKAFSLDFFFSRAAWKFGIADPTNNAKVVLLTRFEFLKIAGIQILQGFKQGLYMGPLVTVLSRGPHAAQQNLFFREKLMFTALAQLPMVEMAILMTGLNWALKTASDWAGGALYEGTEKTQEISELSVLAWALVFMKPAMLTILGKIPTRIARARLEKAEADIKARAASGETYKSISASFIRAKTEVGEAEGKLLGYKNRRLAVTFQGESGKLFQLRARQSCIKYDFEARMKQQDGAKQVVAALEEMVKTNNYTTLGKEAIPVTPEEKVMVLQEFAFSNAVKSAELSKMRAQLEKDAKTPDTSGSETEPAKQEPLTPVQELFLKGLKDWHKMYLADPEKAADPKNPLMRPISIEAVEKILNSNMTPEQKAAEICYRMMTHFIVKFNAVKADELKGKGQKFDVVKDGFSFDKFETVTDTGNVISFTPQWQSMVDVVKISVEGGKIDVALALALGQGAGKTIAIWTAIVSTVLIQVSRGQLADIKILFVTANQTLVDQTFDKKEDSRMLMDIMMDVLARTPGAREKIGENFCRSINEAKEGEDITAAPDAKKGGIIVMSSLSLLQQMIAQSDVLVNVSSFHIDEFDAVLTATPLVISHAVNHYARAVAGKDSSIKTVDDFYQLSLRAMEILGGKVAPDKSGQSKLYKGYQEGSGDAIDSARAELIEKATRLKIDKVMIPDLVEVLILLVPQAANAGVMRTGEKDANGKIIAEKADYGCTDKEGGLLKGTKIRHSFLNLLVAARFACETVNGEKQTLAFQNIYNNFIETSSMNSADIIEAITHVQKNGNKNLGCSLFGWTGTIEGSLRTAQKLGATIKRYTPPSRVVLSAMDRSGGNRYGEAHTDLVGAGKADGTLSIEKIHDMFDTALVKLVAECFDITESNGVKTLTPKIDIQKSPTDNKKTIKVTRVMFVEAVNYQTALARERVLVTAFGAENVDFIGTGGDLAARLKNFGIVGDGRTVQDTSKQINPNKIQIVYANGAGSNWGKVSNWRSSKEDGNNFRPCRIFTEANSSAAFSQSQGRTTGDTRRIDAMLFNLFDVTTIMTATELKTLRGLEPGAKQLDFTRTILEKWNARLDGETSNRAQIIRTNSGINDNTHPSGSRIKVELNTMPCAISVQEVEFAGVTISDEQTNSLNGGSGRPLSGATMITIAEGTDTDTPVFTESNYEAVLGGLGLPQVQGANQQPVNMTYTQFKAVGQTVKTITEAAHAAGGTQADYLKALQNALPNIQANTPALMPAILQALGLNGALDASGLKVIGRITDAPLWSSARTFGEKAYVIANCIGNLNDTQRTAVLKSLGFSGAMANFTEASLRAVSSLISSAEWTSLSQGGQTVKISALASGFAFGERQAIWSVFTRSDTAVVMQQYAEAFSKIQGTSAFDSLTLADMRAIAHGELLTARIPDMTTMPQAAQETIVKAVETMRNNMTDTSAAQLTQDVRLTAGLMAPDSEQAKVLGTIAAVLESATPGLFEVAAVQAKALMEEKKDETNVEIKSSLLEGLTDVQETALSKIHASLGLIADREGTRQLFMIASDIRISGNKDLSGKLAEVADMIAAGFSLPIILSACDENMIAAVKGLTNNHAKDGVLDSVDTLGFLKDSPLSRSITNIRIAADLLSDGVVKPALLSAATELENDQAQGLDIASTILSGITDDQIPESMGAVKDVIAHALEVIRTAKAEAGPVAQAAVAAEGASAAQEASLLADGQQAAQVEAPGAGVVAEQVVQPQAQPEVTMTPERQFVENQKAAATGTPLAGVLGNIANELGDRALTPSLAEKALDMLGDGLRQQLSPAVRRALDGVEKALEAIAGRQALPQGASRGMTTGQTLGAITAVGAGALWLVGAVTPFVAAAIGAVALGSMAASMVIDAMSPVSQLKKALRTLESAAEGTPLSTMAKSMRENVERSKTMSPFTASQKLSEVKTNVTSQCMSMLRDVNSVAATAVQNMSDYMTLSVRIMSGAAGAETAKLLVESMTATDRGTAVGKICDAVKQYGIDRTSDTSVRDLIPALGRISAQAFGTATLNAAAETAIYGLSTGDVSLVAKAAARMNGAAQTAGASTEAKASVASFTAALLTAAGINTPSINEVIRASAAIENAITAPASSLTSAMKAAAIETLHNAVGTIVSAGAGYGNIGTKAAATAIAEMCGLAASVTMNANAIVAPLLQAAGVSNATAQTAAPVILAAAKAEQAIIAVGAAATTDTNAAVTRIHDVASRAVACIASGNTHDRAAALTGLPNLQTQLTNTGLTADTGKALVLSIAEALTKTLMNRTTPLTLAEARDLGASIDKLLDSEELKISDTKALLAQGLDSLRQTAKQTVSDTTKQAEKAEGNGLSLGSIKSKTDTILGTVASDAASKLSSVADTPEASGAMKTLDEAATRVNETVTGPAATEAKALIGILRNIVANIQCRIAMSTLSASTGLETTLQPMTAAVGKMLNGEEVSTAESSSAKDAALQLEAATQNAYQPIQEAAGIVAQYIRDYTRVAQPSVSAADTAAMSPAERVDAGRALAERLPGNGLASSLMGAQTFLQQVASGAITGDRASSEAGNLLNELAQKMMNDDGKQQFDDIVTDAGSQALMGSTIDTLRNIVSTGKATAQGMAAATPTPLVTAQIAAESLGEKADETRQTVADFTRASLTEDVSGMVKSLAAVRGREDSAKGFVFDLSASCEQAAFAAVGDARGTVIRNAARAEQAIQSSFEKAMAQAEAPEQVRQKAETASQQIRSGAAALAKALSDNTLSPEMTAQFSKLVAGTAQTQADIIARGSAMARAATPALSAEQQATNTASALSALWQASGSIAGHARTGNIAKALTEYSDMRQTITQKLEANGLTGTSSVDSLMEPAAGAMKEMIRGRQAGTTAEGNADAIIDAAHEARMEVSDTSLLRDAVSENTAKMLKALSTGKVEALVAAIGGITNAKDAAQAGSQNGEKFAGFEKLEKASMQATASLVAGNNQSVRESTVSSLLENMSSGQTQLNTITGTDKAAETEGLPGTQTKLDARQALRDATSSALNALNNSGTTPAHALASLQAQKLEVSMAQGLSSQVRAALTMALTGIQAQLNNHIDTAEKTSTGTTPATTSAIDQASRSIDEALSQEAAKPGVTQESKASLATASQLVRSAAQSAISASRSDKAGDVASAIQEISSAVHALMSAGTDTATVNAWADTITQNASAELSRTAQGNPRISAEMISGHIERVAASAKTAMSAAIGISEEGTRHAVLTNLRTAAQNALAALVDVGKASANVQQFTEAMAKADQSVAAATAHSRTMPNTETIAAAASSFGDTIRSVNNAVQLAQASQAVERPEVQGTQDARANAFVASMTQALNEELTASGINVNQLASAGAAAHMAPVGTIFTFKNLATGASARLTVQEQDRGKTVAQFIRENSQAIQSALGISQITVQDNIRVEVWADKDGFANKIEIGLTEDGTVAATGVTHRASDSGNAHTHYADSLATETAQEYAGDAVAEVMRAIRTGQNDTRTSASDVLILNAGNQVIGARRLYFTGDAATGIGKVVLEKMVNNQWTAWATFDVVSTRQLADGTGEVTLKDSDGMVHTLEVRLDENNEMTVTETITSEVRALLAKKASAAKGEAALSPPGEQGKAKEQKAEEQELEQPEQAPPSLTETAVKLVQEINALSSRLQGLSAKDQAIMDEIKSLASQLANAIIKLGEFVRGVTKDNIAEVRELLQNAVAEVVRAENVLSKTDNKELTDVLEKLRQAVTMACVNAIAGIADILAVAATTDDVKTALEALKAAAQNAKAALEGEGASRQTTEEVSRQLTRLNDELGKVVLTQETAVAINLESIRTILEQLNQAPATRAAVTGGQAVGTGTLAVQTQDEERATQAAAGTTVDANAVAAELLEKMGKSRAQQLLGTDELGREEGPVKILGIGAGVSISTRWHHIFQMLGFKIVQQKDQTAQAENDFITALSNEQRNGPVEYYVIVAQGQQNILDRLAGTAGFGNLMACIKSGTMRWSDVLRNYSDLAGQLRTEGKAIVISETQQTALQAKGYNVRMVQTSNVDNDTDENIAAQLESDLAY